MVARQGANRDAVAPFKPLVQPGLVRRRTRLLNSS